MRFVAPTHPRLPPPRGASRLTDRPRRALHGTRHIHDEIHPDVRLVALTEAAANQVHYPELRPFPHRSGEAKLGDASRLERT